LIVFGSASGKTLAGPSVQFVEVVYRRHVSVGSNSSVRSPRRTGSCSASVGGWSGDEQRLSRESSSALDTAVGVRSDGHNISWFDAVFRIPVADEPGAGTDIDHHVTGWSESG